MTCGSLRKACDACHASKIKCKSSSPTAPCERCIRLGFNCHYSPAETKSSRKAREEASRALVADAQETIDMASAIDPLNESFWNGIFGGLGPVASTDQCLENSFLPSADSKYLSPISLQAAQPGSPPTVEWMKDQVVESISSLHKHLAAFQYEALLQAIANGANILRECIDDHLQTASLMMLVLTLGFEIVEAVRHVALKPTTDRLPQYLSFSLTPEDIKVILQTLCLRQLERVKASVSVAMRLSKERHKGPSPCVIRVSSERLWHLIEEVEASIR